MGIGARSGVVGACALVLVMVGCGSTGKPLVTSSGEMAVAAPSKLDHKAMAAAVPAHSPEAAWLHEGGGEAPRAVVKATPRQDARKSRTSPRGETAKAAPSATSAPKSKDVSILKLDASEVPAEVRAIEKLIDRPSALLADEVRIEVSKNYEWDVSLSGDAVAPQKADRGGTLAEATGNARAYFRNLDIRSRGKITVWRSGLGVTPFIRIHARGGVSYIDNDDATGKPRVKRAAACQINDAKIAFDADVFGADGAQPAGALTTGR